MSGGAFHSSIRQRSVFLGRVCRDILSLFNRGCSFHDVLFVREFVNTGFTGEPVGVSFFPGERRIADICFRGRVVVAGEPFYPVSFLKLVGTGDNILLVVRLPGRAISRVVGFSGELASGNFFHNRGIHAFQHVFVATGNILVAGDRIVVLGRSLLEAII